MGDPEFWKKKYQDVWPAGSEREKKFVELFESWGLVPIPYGFEALSTEYNPNSPEEKGRPDFYIEINDARMYFEVTGSNVSRVKPDYGLWIRPDKVNYVLKHNIEGYVCHILDNSYNLIRFIDLTSIKERKYVYPVIRGTRETYLEISPNDTISIERMRIILNISNG